MPYPVPHTINHIFNQLGQSWSDDEQRQVLIWLYEDRQLRYLLRFCLYYLGEDAMPCDAEDAWGDFVLQRLPTVIHLYDPNKGRRFWNYLLLCLQRECKRYGQKLNNRKKRERPIMEYIETEEGECEIDLDYDQPQELSDVIQAHEMEKDIILQITNLPSPYRQAFTMYAQDELGYVEIAEQLNSNKQTVRVWVHRARLNLQKKILIEGWS